MNDKISQDTINKALWAACDTFRGTISADTYKDFILTMLFLKYISDVWQDHYDEYKKQYGDAPELIEAMMANERFVLPKSASFYALYERRHEPGNGERIDQRRDQDIVSGGNVDPGCSERAQLRGQRCCVCGRVDDQDCGRFAEFAGDAQGRSDSGVDLSGSVFGRDKNDRHGAHFPMIWRLAR